MLAPTTSMIVLLAWQSAGQEAARPETRRLEMGVERCVELSLQNNPDLSALVYSVEASRGSLLQSQGTFDPLFNARASFSRQNNENPDTLAASSTTHRSTREIQTGIGQTLFTGGTYSLSFISRRNETFPDNGGFFNFNPSVSSALNLTLTQPLLRGGWTSYNKAPALSAEMDAERAERQYDERFLETINAVHSAYWDLVFARENLEVKKLALTLAQQLLEINEKKVKEGVSAPVEVLQAETEIAVRRQDLITAENAVRSAEDVLKLLILPFREGEDWDFQIVPNSPVPRAEASPAPPVWEEAMGVALQRRPDLARLRLDLRQRELALEVAKNELAPKLNFEGSHSSAGLDSKFGDAYDDVRGNKFQSYSVALVLEVPFGNWAAKGKARAAAAQCAVTRQSLRTLENTVAREVRDAIRNLQFLREQIAATKKSRELAEKQLEAEQRKFDVGLSTNYQVLQFQQDLTQALTNEKSAVLNHAKALITLRKVQGTLRP